MKVLSVIEKPYTKDGQAKTRWEVALQKADGTTIGATSFELLKVGDEIADDRVHADSKYPDKWVIYSEKKPKGNYQRNDDLAVAQAAVKLAVDLALAGKIGLPLTEAVLTQHGIMIAKSIMAVSRAIKPDNKPEPKPKQKPEGPRLNSKQLFAKIKEAQVTVTECQKIPGFVDAVNSNDYDEAWTLVQARIK